MQEITKQTTTLSPVGMKTGIDLDAQLQLTQKRVLVIDDDPASVNLIKRIFMENGYNVSGATSGQEGLKKLVDIHPSLVILDLLMPEMDGEDTLKAIRIEMNVPVMIISAIDDKKVIIHLLQAGADDYLVKPFDESVLLARAQAVLRRAERFSPNHVFSFPEIGLSLDMDTYEVIYQNTRIHLTGKMFDVLAQLVRNAPRVVNYQDLTIKVWGENTPAVRNRLKYLVYLLRKEFLAVDPSVEVFENIDRLGYRLCSTGQNPSV